MPYDAGTLSLLEDALADAFEYHNNLDSFVLRADIRRGILDAARTVAEDRNRARRAPGARAPKRYVVQELLTQLSGMGDAGDRAIASLITGLLRASPSSATPGATAAIQALRERIGDDRKERQRIAAEHAEQRREEQEQRDRERFAGEAARRKKRGEFHARFLALIQHQDAQQRGYALERFLPEFFGFEGFPAQGAFRIVGEQIDGAFVRGPQVHLVEAKWVSKPISGAEFGAFLYKLGGKTEDTRGLYLSINGYSPEAITSLNAKGALKFVCMDGAHLMRCLEPGLTFVQVLEALWAHAGRTGEAYLPAPSLNL